MALTARGWEVVDPSDTVVDYPAAMALFGDQVGKSWYAVAVTVSWGGTASNGSGATSVTFPVGRFTAAPVVVATAEDRGVGGPGVIAMVGGLTATGCVVTAWCSTALSSATSTVRLIAIQAG